MLCSCRGSDDVTYWTWADECGGSALELRAMCSLLLEVRELFKAFTIRYQQELFLGLLCG